MKTDLAGEVRFKESEIVGVFSETVTDRRLVPEQMEGRRRLSLMKTGYKLLGKIALVLLLGLSCRTAFADWPNGYKYSGTITIPASQVSNTDQINFPVLVTGTYPELAAAAGRVTNPNGYDIVFASDPGGFNKLNFERQSYVAATGKIVFWVQVPLLSHTADTVFYVFYGNSSIATDQATPGGAWDSSYLGVWHLEGNPAGAAPQELDSTSNGNHVTAVGSWSPSSLVPGEIGSSIHSAVNNQGFTSTSPSLTPTTSMTVSAWVNTSIGDGIPTIMSQYDFVNGSAGYYFIVNGNRGTLRLKMSAGNNGGTLQTTYDALSGTITDGQWHYVAGTYSSGSNPVLYVDGNVVPAPATNGTLGPFVGSLANTTPFEMVPYGFNPFYYEGNVDEPRLAKVARSGDWISTQYRTQSSPSTFYSVAWGQTRDSSIPWLSSSPSSLSFRGTAASNPPTQQITVSNVGGGTLDWSASASQPWILLSTTPGVTGSSTPPPVSGAGTQPLYVQTASTGMTPGTYSGTITISAAGITGSPQTVDVSLIVLAAPYPNGYSYSGTITVPASQVPNTDQVNFPVLISGTYPELAALGNGSGKVTNPNGYDIIFTSDAAGANRLNFERESYTPATGQAVFWVQVPVLSHTTDNVIYVFYGNFSVAADQSNKNATWDSSFGAVWHLANAAATDSTTNGINGTNTGATAATGEIAGGASLGGSAYLDMGANVPGLHPATGFTVESWVKPTSTVQSNYAGFLVQDIFTPRASPWVSYKLGLNANNAARYEFEMSTNVLGDVQLDSGVPFVNGAWAHVAGTWDGATMRIYVNGVLKASRALGGTMQYNSTGRFRLGGNSGAGETLIGLLDEARVSSTARSADWIATEFSNQYNPSAFYTAAWGQTWNGEVTPTPTLSVNPTTLTYTGVAGGANPAAQSFAISNTGSGTLSWTATASQPWVLLATTANGAGQASISGTGAQTLYVQVSLTGLAANPYSGAVNLTANGTNPTAAVSVPLTVTPGSTGGPTTYSYYGTITLAHTLVPNTDQVNFPVLISGTYPDLANTANGGKVTNANGYDIIFTSDANGTNKLNFERESYSAATGQVSFWVQVPNLSHTTDTAIYVFYGNSSVTTDQSNKNATWGSSYAGVWHLASVAATDSTTGANNGTNTNATAASGQIAGGVSLGGTAYLDMGANVASLHPLGALTVESWVKPTSTVQSNYAGFLVQDYVSPRASPWVSYKLGLNANNGGHYEFELSTTGGGDTLLDSSTGYVNGTWAHVVGTWDGANMRIYVNGVQKSSKPLTGTIQYTSTGRFRLGSNSAGSETVNAAVDEARVSSVARSADWIAAEYNNQINPAAFYSAVWGLIPGGGGGGTPALSVNPTTLTYTGVTGGANPAAQSFAIGNTGGGTLSWTATASQPWMLLATTANGAGQTSISGTGAQTLYVQVSLTGLATNAYSGAVNLTANGTNPTAAVNVPLTVSATPALSVNPTTLTYTGVTGGANPAVQSFDISNTGGGTLSWTATASQPWMLLATTANGAGQASISGTGAQTLYVQVSLTGLAANAYSGAVNLTANGTNPTAAVNVPLTVTATPALSVNPTTLTYTGVTGGANPAAQSFDISNTGGGTLSWTATASQPWMLLATTANGAGQASISGTGAQTLYVQVSLTGLAANPYSGAVNLTANGTNPTAAVNVPLTVSAGATTYSYSGTITLSHTLVPNTDQVNFPVLISGTYPDLANTANGGKVTNANGYDIIFTSDANGTNKLNFERESYSAATGQVSFWVQVPNLSHTTDTVIYVFYGNSSVTTDQSNKNATWGGGYAGVWHLASVAATDSTAGANNGTNTNATAAPGEIAGGVSLGGTAYLDMGANVASLHPLGALTVESWVKPTSAVQSNYAGFLVQDIYSPRQTPWVSYKLGLNTNNAGKYEFELSTTIGADILLDSGVPFVSGTWAHVVGTYDGTTMRIYVNGVLKGSKPVGGTVQYNSTGRFRLGSNSAGAETMNAVVDEARVSSVARSADWIATEYNNQINPSAFYSTVWGLSSTPTLSVSPTTLTYQATLGGSNPATQSFAISNTAGGTLNWTATASQPWMLLATTANGAGQTSISGTGAQTLYVQVSLTGLATNSYSGAVNITANGTNPSAAVNVPLTVSASWPSGYSYAGKITVPPSQVPAADKLNFPVLFAGTYPDLATTGNGGKVTNPNGYDIIFTSDANGLNRLNFERESYTAATGQVAFWVQVPLLSHSSNTSFYVFYGNPAVTTDQSNKNATWDNNFSGVWHLSDGAATESTANGNHGSNTNAASAAGEIAGGAGLGGNAYLDMGANRTTLQPTTGLTLESWVKPTASTQNNYAGFLVQDYILPRGNPWISYKLGLNTNNANKYEFELSTTAGGDTFLDSGVPYVNGTWAHVVGTWDGITMRIYVNGVLKSSKALGGTIVYNSTGRFRLGANGAGGETVKAALDEARVSTIARSADWIAMEYSNQSNPSGFYSVFFGLTPDGVPPDPALSAYPLSLSYTGASGSNVPTPAQPVVISSSNSGTLNDWTATASQSWIVMSSSSNGSYSAQPLSGTGVATIYIQALTGLLDVGPYTGTVTISAPGATASPQTINVSVTVTPNPASAPPVSPSNLFFSTTLASPNPTLQSVSIAGPGGSPLGDWTATPSDPWITLSTTSGTGAQSFAVGVASSSMGLGRYTGTVAITSAGAPQTLSVTLVIAPTQVANSGGATLYNGIVLPSQWPPAGPATQAYSIPPYIANPPAVIPIDVGRQLFVDDFLIQQTTLVRTQHRPVMYPGNPILAPNGVNADTLNMTFPYSDGVWFDPQDQQFKMWFFCGYGAQVCYATSTDGKSWTRPNIPGAPLNNTDVVLGPIGGGRDSDVVWMDLQDPNPAQKFKLFAYYPTSPVTTMLTWFSPDGITWTSQPQFNIHSLQDRTTLFWNPFRSVWVDSMRQQFTVAASPYRGASSSERMRFYAESPDLTTWSPSNFTDSFWTGPDENDPPYLPGGTYPQLYNLDAVAYESVMVGMFSWFHPGPMDGSPAGAPGPDVVELGVGFSRDGFNWVRPTRGGGPSNAFIPASNIPDTWNEGNTQSAGGAFLVVGDQLWFYFSGRTGDHSSSPGGATGLATLRRDGFYSMDAGSTPGTLTTRPLQFSGKDLFVNVRDPQGSLQVQVLNSAGTVLATSLPITADSTLQPVTWSGISDLSGLAAQQPLRFQFTLTNGELYAFWVSTDANGASNGYVAAGGPGFTSNVDTIGAASLSAAVTGTPTFSVSSSNVVLAALVGSANPATQVLNVSDLGGTLSWTVSADQPWITLSATSGTGSQDLRIGANITGLAAGGYSGTVTINAPDATPSSQTVNVTLTISSATSFVASPSSVAFAAPSQLSSPAPLPLNVSNPGGAPDWTATANQPWVTLSTTPQGPGSSSLPGSGAETLWVGAATAGLTPGSLSGSITFRVSGVPVKTVDVTLMLATGAGGGAQHFVGPGGSPSGDGSIDHPWDLQTALNQPASVHPGDVIWVLGGTYFAMLAPNGAFSSNLNGTGTYPIVVRNYHRQRATIEAKGASMGLFVYGSYSWFWGLEVVDSTTERQSQIPGSGGGTNSPSVFAASGTGNRFINMIIHDTADGFFAGSASVNTEFNGNLIYNIGWNGPDRGHGHGFYVQNQSPSYKWIIDNIIFQGFGEGIQCYGSPSASIQNFLFDGNTIFNAGLLTGTDDYNMLLAGGGGGPQNITFTNNYTYHEPARGNGQSSLPWGFDTAASNLFASGNYWIGGNPALDINAWSGATFTNEVVYGPTQYTLTAGGLHPSTYNWDNNFYFSQSTVFAQLNSQNQTFATWRSATGLDANSTLTQGPPTGIWIFTRPNQYEPGRGNITIYNWDLASSVSVDVSNILTVGSPFSVLNAQDIFGSPVVAGTYAGGTISIPMMGLPVSPAIGNVSYQPGPIGPNFGVFVVVPL